MEITLRFHVVQYFDGLSKTKGRNVAVLGFDGVHCHYRALGVHAKKVSPEYFQSLSSTARDSIWVYREWVHWFESLLKIRNVEHFNAAIRMLQRNNYGLKVTHDGFVEIDARSEVPALMDNIFKRLVRIPRISPVVAFDNQVTKIFERSEIKSDQKFFNEPVEVELVSDDPGDVVTLEFSHLLSGDRPVGFNTIVLQDVKQQPLPVQAERITENFKNAVRTGFLERECCVLLCGPVQEKHREFIGQFSEIATVLDVFDESAANRISRLVHPGRSNL